MKFLSFQQEQGIFLTLQYAHTIKSVFTACHLVWLSENKQTHKTLALYFHARHVRSPFLRLYSSSLLVHWGGCTQLPSPISYHGWRPRPRSSLLYSQSCVHPATRALQLLIPRIWRTYMLWGVPWFLCPVFFWSLQCSGLTGSLLSCLPVLFLFPLHVYIACVWKYYFISLFSLYPEGRYLSEKHTN